MSEKFTNDHDALITLIAEVRQLRVEVKEMKESSVTRIERLEATTIKAAEFIAYKTELAEELEKHTEVEEYHAKEIDSLRLWRTSLTATMSVSGAVTVYLAIKLFEHLTKTLQ